LLAVLALAVAAGSPSALGCLLPIARTPRLYLQWGRARRTARIELQLDTWLVVLANALRATPSLGDALGASAERIAPPLRHELQLIGNEVRLGVPLDRALQHAAQRIESPLVRAAFATLRIARNAGGDLSRTLDASAASLREMARLHGVLRAKTAEGRAQSLLIALLPAPLIGMLETLSPDLMTPLWTTPRGHLVLAAAGALWLCAVLAARRITAVEI
jgi:tight adherence protein B